MVEYDAEGERSATPLIIEDPEPEPESDAEGERSAPIGIREGTNEWSLLTITNHRNALLQQTDKYVLPDFNITPEKLEFIKTYRQTLRDFININKDLILSGEIVELPQIPI